MDHTANSPSSQGELQSRTREMLRSASSVEVSIVELVVAATECSDDAYEIDDLVHGLVESGRFQVRRREADPMLARAF